MKNIMDVYRKDQEQENGETKLDQEVRRGGKGAITCKQTADEYLCLAKPCA